MKRPGAFSITVRVWDIDLQQVLNIRKAQGEERLRARNIHPAVAVDDVFMSRVKKFYEGDTEVTYTTFNPYDVPDLCDTYGEDFKKRYLEYEAKFLSNPDDFCPGTAVVKVKDIYSSIIGSIVTEHYPYVTYIDTVNKANPHPEFGPIRCGNLCVHGDTLITTDTGVYEIRELLGQYVNVWNGSKFSCTLIEDTGRSSGYEIILSNGPTIKVTPEHKFVLEDGSVVSASELKERDKLKKFKLPAFDLNIIKNSTHKDVIEYLEKTLPNRVNVVTDEFEFELRVSCYFKIPNSEIDKVFTSLRSIGIDCRIDRVNANLKYIVLDCIGFRDLMELDIIKNLEMSGEITLFNIISSRLEKNTKESTLPPFFVSKVNKIRSEFQSFCGTEKDKNSIMFNGIVTKNCQEVMLPANENEMAVCNLGSINLARVYEYGIDDQPLLEEVTRLATRYLDRTIDVTTYPSDCAKRTQERMRSIGLGLVGEAECIAHKQIHYGSKEHESFIHKLYSTIRDVAHKTTIELAKELGPCEAIANPPVRNGYLMCIAPNTNTGIFASTTSGCEPVFGVEWLEDNRNCGSIRLTAPHITLENYPYYKDGFNIDPYKLIDMCAARQQYIDMSISFSLFLKTDGISGKWLGGLYLYAWEKGVKSMYYIRSEGVTTTVESNCENCAN